MYTEITDVTGKVWTSDVLTTRQILAKAGGDIDAAVKGIESIHELFKNFSQLKYLSMVVHYQEVYFNPDNVIMAKIVRPPDRKRFEWAERELIKGNPDPELDAFGQPTRA